MFLVVLIVVQPTLDILVRETTFQLTKKLKDNVKKAKNVMSRQPLHIVLNAVPHPSQPPKKVSEWGRPLLEQL